MPAARKNCSIEIMDDGNGMMAFIVMHRSVAAGTELYTTYGHGYRCQ